MRRLLKYKRGSFIILWAILLPVLLGLTGLVIDIGYAYVNRTRLQHIADAAALAGAARLEDETIATNLATAYINENGAVTDTIDITFGTVTLTYKDKVTGKDKTRTHQRINIDFTAQSTTYFLRIFGEDYRSIPIGVHAAAVGPADPNPFDFALVSAGDQQFTLFGQGAPAGNQYQGSVWANGPVKIDDGKATHTQDQLTGNLITASPNLPPDLGDHEVFADQVKTDYEKMNVDYAGTNANDAVKEFVSEITNTSNTYSSAHPCNKDGAIDYNELDSPLYVNGDFEKGTLIAPDNTFEQAQEVVIVAIGDIKLTDARVNDPKAKIILCSLTGHITFNGSIENFPEVIFLAPNGTININCGVTHMTGSLIGQKVEVGNAGNLQIKNNGADADDKSYTIRLVE